MCGIPMAVQAEGTSGQYDDDASFRENLVLHAS